MAKICWRTVVLGALLITGAAPVMADDLADLKSRLDAIEQENDQLRSDLEAMKKSDEDIVGQVSQLGQEVNNKADKKADDPLSMSAKWNNGFEATSKDKRFKFHVDAVGWDFSPE